MFRPSDVRRVQAACDKGLDAPYEAQVQLENMRKTLRVVIMDPDDEALPVGQAYWWFDDNAPVTVKQPPDDEVFAILASLKQSCTDYPTRKAAQAVEQAERKARQELHAKGRAAEAAAQAEKAKDKPQTTPDVAPASPPSAQPLTERRRGPGFINPEA